MGGGWCLGEFGMGVGSNPMVPTTVLITNTSVIFIALSTMLKFLDVL